MNRHSLGTFLVSMQFTSLGLHLLLAALSLDGDLPETSTLTLLALGLALGAWALICNRPGNFSLLPEPRPGGRFIQTGPYRWVRHPMYVALLLISAALGGITDSFPGWMLSLTLLGVLLIKAGFEDRWMAEAHPGYADYLARTRGFIPFIY